ncbi:hypothetical protein KFU94_56940 [Chloroflexi bacterium TSY]|nr:hypothetical protein [Chloroflexi bacterium TSY]
MDLLSLVLLVPNVNANPSLDTLAQSSTSSGISYQGYLTDSQGNPINDDMHIKFVLYEREFGGVALGCEEHEQVQVNNGIFQAELGGGASLARHVAKCTEVSLIEISDLYSDVLWLEIIVRNNQNKEEKMTPRQRLTGVIRAVNAERLDGKDANTFVTQDQLNKVLQPMTTDLEKLTTSVPRSEDAVQLGGKDASSYVTQDQLAPLATAVANLAISVPRSEDTDRLGGKDASSFITQDQLEPLAAAVANQTDINDRLNQVETKLTQLSNYSTRLTDLERADSQFSAQLMQLQSSVSTLSSKEGVSIQQFEDLRSRMDRAFYIQEGNTKTLQGIGGNTYRNGQSVASCQSGYTAIAVVCEISNKETYMVSERGSFLDSGAGVCNFRFDANNDQYSKKVHAKVLCVDSTFLR